MIEESRALEDFVLSIRSEELSALAAEVFPRERASARFVRARAR